MGDIPPVSTTDVRSNAQSHPNADNAEVETPSHDQSVAPELSALQNYPISPPHTVKPQSDMTQPSVQRQGPYNMGPMAHSLPQAPFRHGQYPYPNPNQQRYQMTNSPPVMQHMPQFMGHQVPVPNQGYYVQQPQLVQYYGSHIPQPQVGGTGSSRQNMAYYPNQMMINQQSSGYYYPPTSHYLHSTHPMTNTMMPSQFMNPIPSANDARNTFQSTPSRLDNPSSPPTQGQTSSWKQPLVKSELRRGPDEVDKRQSAVRGPPRKPRQSGHAIWVGNLPPQTNLMSLVYHVCKEALGLESLFLISKSNCAFANFKDEETCVAAQQKLHDSKFQSVRLVSRLRKSTVEGATGVTAPTGPAVITNSAAKNEQSQEGQYLGTGSSTPGGEQASTVKQPPLGEIDTTTQKDKFFILKSLTVEDLELSVRTGIWATQSHNEETLNEAFKTVDSVYLVFSANKSGEYFGYARMTSQINEDPAAAIEFAPKTVAASDLDLPKAIPTEATEHAPKGRIIDDSARGTIFWEAERDEADNTSDTESVSSDNEGGAEEESTKTWGKPFKLEWLSTTQLPFYRTRGLRNPWNSNREVKIARDGTEIEPSVGRRLIGLFNRVQSPGPVAAGMQLPMAMMPGFAPM